MEKTKLSIISNLWTKMISLEKGDVHEGHCHTFDHTHLLAVGKVKIVIDGKETIFEAPTQIFIKRDLIHSMECLSNESVGWCIHPIRKGFRVEDIYDPSLCPSLLEDEEASKMYPTSQLTNPGHFVETPSRPWDEDA